MHNHLFCDLLATAQTNILSKNSKCQAKFYINLEVTHIQLIWWLQEKEQIGITHQQNGYVVNPMKKKKTNQSFPSSTTFCFQCTMIKPLQLRANFLFTIELIPKMNKKIPLSDQKKFPKLPFNRIRRFSFPFNLETQ